ncbi:death-associated inhibitor of apoptosis 2-like [Saccostrea cucullata]|uniref:death-associated inhibitor of apoptosis 2-like n=1 Tax=Saccostrea cuccullata TaxID=36930 RepID=UPI002ED1B752
MTEKLLDQPMRYPQYARLSKREATFEQGWPEPLLGKIPDLARAGLYYRGVKDSATCFHCGFTFSNWDPEDDPCVEHAYWNPNCSYINLYKGRGWVMNVFITCLEQQGYKPLPEIKPLLNPQPDVQARGKFLPHLSRRDSTVQTPISVLTINKGQKPNLGFSIVKQAPHT